ncbi:UNVERIFIED_CONTAM: hypothetical protein Sradi_0306900 [Sesamum radiatum]|uniref:Cytochrome c-552/DMSO reductase-like haem-binding domain-containing protein n=1 Tax=Sesamum radiatum TaxID=300843 RepID=A0AAW2W792_SESRA
MLRLRVFALLIAAAVLGPIGRVNSHTESGDWHCDLGSGIRVRAQFIPGIITVDGKVDDWKDVEGSNFPLLPALDPDADKEYSAGKLTLKAVHDGKEAYFMLQVNGNYVYTQGDSSNCPSVALMFQIGENASYHRMGGCEQGLDTCTNKTCHGHEVDIMHFSLGSAIPGRLYGGNPIDNREGYGGDRFGHLVDVYSWNPHCRFLDGMSPSGFIKDDSPYASEGQKGTYYFEFSRPLRTMDRLQQDAQFTIGKSSKLSAAFWYPMDGKPWHGSAHYSISCDWILLDFISGGSESTKVAQGSPWDVATAFSLLFSVVAFCMAIFIGHRLSRINRTGNFIPMDNL